MISAEQTTLFAVGFILVASIRPIGIITIFTCYKLCIKDSSSLVNKTYKNIVAVGIDWLRYSALTLVRFAISRKFKHDYHGVNINDIRKTFSNQYEYKMNYLTVNEQITQNKTKQKRK
eukprot:319044_1